MRVPSIVTLPLVGTSNLLIQRKKVDLPDPEGPITAITSFSLISSLMGSSCLLIVKHLRKIKQKCGHKISALQ